MLFTWTLCGSYGDSSDSGLAQPSCGRVQKAYSYYSQTHPSCRITCYPFRCFPGTDHWEVVSRGITPWFVQLQDFSSSSSVTGPLGLSYCCGPTSVCILPNESAPEVARAHQPIRQEEPKAAIGAPRWAGSWVWLECTNSSGGEQDKCHPDWGGVGDGRGT